jgi:hypothetical protein
LHKEIPYHNHKEIPYHNHKEIPYHKEVAQVAVPEEDPVKVVQVDIQVASEVAPVPASVTSLQVVVTV